MQPNSTKYTESTPKDDALRRLWNQDVSDISESEMSDALAIFRFRLLSGQTEHLRNRRAVDVGIQQAGACALLRQRQRQIDRRRAFADAALAGSHGDDVLHAGQGFERCLDGMGDNLETHIGIHAADPRHGRHRLFHQPPDAFDLRLRRIAQFDLQRHDIAFDGDVFDFA